MRRLSGWARLWIVGAVLWWVVAGTMAAISLHVMYPQLIARDHRECISEKLPFQASSRWEAWSRCEEEYQQSPQRELDERNLAEERRAYSARFVIYPLFVIAAPFVFWLIAAGIFGVARWVWRGFRPATNGEA